MSFQTAESVESQSTTFSLEEVESFWGQTSYHGITLTQINNHMKAQYNKYESETSSSQDGASCIHTARWKVKTEDYRIEFSAPEIRPLCEHELYFILKIKGIYSGEDQYVILALSESCSHINYRRTDQVVGPYDVVFVVRLFQFDATLKILRVNLSGMSGIVSWHNTISLAM